MTKQQIKDGEEPLVKRFVMLHSDGKHDGKPDYYISTSDKKFRTSRCNIVAHNSGLVFV